MDNVQKFNNCKIIDSALYKDKQVYDLSHMMYRKRDTSYKTRDYHLMCPRNLAYIGIHGYKISASTFDSRNLIYIGKRN
jgi:hypothetical protein